MYWLIVQEVNGPYGKVLDYVEPIDPCAGLDAEDHQRESEKVEAELCRARRLTSRVELNQWLIGVFDGRTWEDGWQPADEE